VTDGPADLTLVVPLYNEAVRLRRCGAQLIDFVARQPGRSALVLVDDGSRDGTAALSEELAADQPDGLVRTIRRPHEGKGAAIRAGLDTATTQLAGFCDLDLSTPLPHFQRLVDDARATGALAIGSRDVPTSVLTVSESALRELLGKAFNRVVQVVLTRGIRDTQCGAKAAPTPVWHDILAHSRENGFAWDVEVVALAMRLGVPVHEIGVEWRYDHDSRVRVGRDGIAMLLAVPRIRRNVMRAARSSTLAH
jgi:dolichyl-phosphate beta-glucosyltransferase